MQKDLTEVKIFLNVLNMK